LTVALENYGGAGAAVVTVFTTVGERAETDCKHTTAYLNAAAE